MAHHHGADHRTRTWSTVTPQVAFADGWGTAGHAAQHLSVTCHTPMNCSKAELAAHKQSTRLHARSFFGHLLYPGTLLSFWRLRFRAVTSDDFHQAGMEPKANG